jgi:catechol 2,3-dioxygenase-like lactoylglutathione lyase family enzyme
MPPLAQLSTVVVDCAEPVPLARFYAAVTGWRILHSAADFAQLGGHGPVALGFQRVEGHQPPAWPDPAKQVHLDFRVPDVERAVEELLALGAARPEFQPGGKEWVVLTDPEGHPFCLAAGE